MLKETKILLPYQLNRYCGCFYAENYFILVPFPPPSPPPRHSNTYPQTVVIILPTLLSVVRAIWQCNTPGNILRCTRNEAHTFDCRDVITRYQVPVKTVGTEYSALGRRCISGRARSDPLTTTTASTRLIAKHKRWKENIAWRNVMPRWVQEC